MKGKIEEMLNTNLIGTNIIVYDKIDSTQLEAKRINRNNTVIIAKKQTKGIGTHDRIWYNGNENTNIAMTITFHPNCNISKIKNITIDIADVISNILKKEYNIETKIKAPNDIILNNKKLAGILVETILNGENVSAIFIGIGMNVNQIEFPKEIEIIATSLKKEFDKSFSVEEIIAKILGDIEDKILAKL